MRNIQHSSRHSLASFCSYRYLFSLLACLLLLGMAATALAAPPPPFPPTITVEEYPVGSADDGGPSGWEYRERLTADVLAVRAAWRADTPSARMERINAKLQPFGYRFAVRPGDWESHASLMRGQAVVVANTFVPSRVEVNRSRSDFAMVIENTPNTRPFHLLVTKAGPQAWDPFLHGYAAPTFLDDDLVVLDADISSSEMKEIPYKVMKGNTVLYEGISPPVFVDLPIKGLWSWDGHWALEIDGRLVIDGVDHNAVMGYDRAYGFRIINHQPFYFYETTSISTGEKEGMVVGVSYATWDLPQQYDEVIHYRCCEPSMFNPAGNDTMVWFWARRDGVWYYVEAGAYQ